MRWYDVLGLIALATFVVTAWGFWAVSGPAWADALVGISDLTKAGQWGDSFGVLNALIGSIGSIGIVATLIAQARALSTQQVDQHKQRFDSTFFQLIALLRELRSEIYFTHSQQYQLAMPTSKLINKTTKQGIAAIKAANLELRYWLTIDAAPKKIDSKYLQTVYEKYVHTRYEAEIGAYFRVLYNILRRLKDDKILSDDEKEQYANLLRGQLTSHELILAGINSCHPVAKNLHLYIKHFQLLKYAPRGRLREIILSVHGKGMVEKPRTASPGLLKRLSNLLQFPKSSAR